MFTFTCEDCDAPSSVTSEASATEPPPPPPPPAPDRYERESSESGDAPPAPLPPQMRPIEPRLALDLFQSRGEHFEQLERARRCTGRDECVSACECCRTPHPDPQPIPFIDGPDADPVIFENGSIPDGVATPKVRRILPQLSLDLTDDRQRPETADATCQTPSTPLDDNTSRVPPIPPPMPRSRGPVPEPSIPAARKLDLSLDVRNEADKIQNVHSRLRRTLYDMTRSFSINSENTELPSTGSPSESTDERVITPVLSPPVDSGAKRILDCADKKSWKSPDEYRPAFGKVRELTKHFNSINLTYCVKDYKRNCRSSPNLSIRDEDRPARLPASVSLADIQCSWHSVSSTTHGDKLSDEEVRSILIQLEDWSKYGSRGSEDTLAHGCEFELPNLPSEECSDLAPPPLAFAEIEKRPRRITLDNIRLKGSCVPNSRGSVGGSESEERAPRARATPRESVTLASSPEDVAVLRSVTAAASSLPDLRQTCPALWRASSRKLHLGMTTRLDVRTQHRTFYKCLILWYTTDFVFIIY